MGLFELWIPLDTSDKSWHNCEKGRRNQFWPGFFPPAGHLSQKSSFSGQHRKYTYHWVCYRNIKLVWSWKAKVFGHRNVYLPPDFKHAFIWHDMLHFAKIQVWVELVKKCICGERHSKKAGTGWEEKKSKLLHGTGEKFCAFSLAAGWHNLHKAAKRR